MPHSLGEMKGSLNISPQAASLCKVYQIWCFLVQQLCIFEEKDSALLTLFKPFCYIKGGQKERPLL